MNSALANYDTIVKDVYGLFAMSQNETPEELNKRIRTYFEKTLVSYGVTDEDSAGDYLNTLLGDFNSLVGGVPGGDITTLLGMEIPAEDFNVVLPESSSLANPGVMRKQIVDYMKFRGPVNFGLSIFDVANSFSTIEAQSDVVEKQVVAQESMQDVTNGCKVTIEEIRYYDEQLFQIQEGDSCVKGKLKSNDEQFVKVEDYKTQILRYRSDSDSYEWDASYEHINRLIMCFLLKVPKTDNLYLKNINVNDKSQYFIKTEGENTVINSSKSGISISVPTSGDDATAESNFNSQINVLSSSSTHAANAKKYTDYDFVKQSYISSTDNKIIKDTEDSAIASFVEYEKFLTDASDAKVKYSDIKVVLEELYKLQKYYDKYHGILEKKESDAKSEMDSAKSAMDSCSDSINGLKDSLNKAKDNLAKATTASEVSAIAGTIGSLNGQIATKEAELDGLTSTYNTKKSAYDAAHEKQENCKAKYSECASRYMSLGDNFVQDISDYARYQDGAEKVVTEEVTKIYNQFSKIVNNLYTLTYSLDNTVLYLGEIYLNVQEYDGNVQAWEAANNSYTSANGNDTFAAANKGEISASRKKINEEQINNLKLYVDSLAQEYRDIYNYITDNTADFKYGNSKVYYIASYNDALSQAKTKKDSLPQIVTKADADAMFASMYKESEAPDVFNDLQLKLSLVKPDMAPFAFLSYLNSSYPPEEEATDEQKEQKKTYDEMVSNLKDDNQGGAISDGADYTGQYVDGGTNATADTGPFGYTYAGKSINTANLPSADYASQPKSSSAQGLKIGGSGDKLEASGSMNANSSLISSIAGGAKSLASTSLENIYIIDYIFENFSYNTMMQDAILKGEGYKDKKASIIEVTGKLNECSAKYKDKVVTLSNVPINAYNNYLYGGEIEYIVYGSTDPKANVTSAKATIYAIRTAFNMIYAFTNQDIRNETRAIGVSVQAATMGVVPYQVVQVVLQLALAFAESAIDLTAICNGMDVVLFKSEDTWNLSIKHATQLATNYLAEAASEFASNAISNAGEAIQRVVDAKADELIDSVNKLSEDLQAATQNELKQIIGQGMEYLENEMFAKLEELTLVDYNNATGTLKTGVDLSKVMSKQQVHDFISGQMDEAIGAFRDGLPNELTGIPMADSVLISLIQNEGEKIGYELKDTVLTYVDANYANLTGGSNNVTELLCTKMTEWRTEMLNKVLDVVTSKQNEIAQYVTSKVDSVVGEAKSQLDSYISGYTDEMSEEVAAGIKEKVTSYSNSFIDKYIPSNSATNIGNSAGGKNSESLSSIIKLGYKDYLMLFAFIEISLPSGSDKMLTRVSDVIQFNMQNSSASGTFQHKKGSEFLMKNAYTYVGIDAKVDMDMLFIDMELFRRSFDDETGTYDTALSKYGVIDYTGLQGY